MSLVEIVGELDRSVPVLPLDIDRVIAHYAISGHVQWMWDDCQCSARQSFVRNILNEKDPDLIRIAPSPGERIWWFNVFFVATRHNLQSSGVSRW